MNIFITGAAGFIGSHLAERFASLNYNVIGLDCLLNNYSPTLKKLNIELLAKKGVQFHYLDLAQDDIDTVVQDVDFVFHLAAQPGIAAAVPFRSYEQNNIIATKRLLDAATKAKAVKGFINISTSSVYGLHATGDETCEPRPISDYGITKLAAEQLVLAEARNNHITACSLRLFSVYGPRERPEKLYFRLIKSILKNTDFPLYAGSDNHIRSYTFIDDVIDGMVLVLNNIQKCNGEIFNIGTDKAITTGNGIKIVEQILNKKAKIKIIPQRPGDQQKTQANITKAKEFFGYNPKIEPEIGLQAEIEWLQSIVDKIDE